MVIYCYRKDAWDRKRIETKRRNSLARKIALGLIERE